VQLNKACSRIIASGTKPPIKKIVITGCGGVSYRRSDGTYVIPFWMLKP
jgi:hypothetical protein